MAQIDVELGRLIRRYIAGQERNPGAVAPESRDAQATPYHDTDSGRIVGLASGSQGNHAERDATGPARRGAANDYAWRRQDRQEIRAYRESMIDMDVVTGAVATLDPNAVTCYRLRAAGSFTVAFVDPVPPDLGEDAETPLYVTSMVFRVSRPAGASITWPAGALFQKPLRDLAAAESPLGPAGEASLDEFVCEYWPGDGWSVNSSSWRLA